MLLHELDAFQPDKRTVNVVVETSQGSANKLKYDTRRGVFMLSHVLPAGAFFPFDFGFIPSTKADDGDPLDVLVLMDHPTPMGVVLTVRLIAVIEAEQTEDGKTERNDRLIGVALSSKRHSEVGSQADLSPQLRDELGHFFVSYNQMQGKEFRVLGWKGPDEAVRLVEKSGV